MEAIIVAYQNITTRQYVRNVDRLHRRWKSGNQIANKNTRRAEDKVEKLTAKVQVPSEWSWSPKSAQMQRRQKACRHVRNVRKDLRGLSGQTRKGYSEEPRDDNADTNYRGMPWRQYDPKLIRSRSRFEGVGTPRNEWNRCLRKKTTLQQTRTSTSKRDEKKSALRERKDGGTCSHNTHDAGKEGPRKKNWANLQRFRELIL